MDKRVKRKKWTVKKIAYLSIAIVVGAVIIYLLGSANYESKLKVDENSLTIAAASNQIFQEYITQTGSVLPKTTNYLDAVEGGNIVQVFEESGALLSKGDPILELENINLRLSVLGQENSLNEQINRVRTTRLQLDQNYLSQKQLLAQIENQLQILGPKYIRDSTLFSKELISKSEFEKTDADYKYNVKSKRFTYESFLKDSTSRLLQLSQLNSSELNMIENLRGVKQILDNLIIKAPIDGQLATSRLQAGQNVNKGDRLGEVHELGSYKVEVPIDELYLSRITQGLKATAITADSSYQLVISYIYPTIVEGRFKVDMEFIGEIPQDIKKGQSLRLRIELGKSSEELVIPNGGFYNKTGGKWILVVDKEENKAIKRSIKLGRKNSDQYEVLEGLKPGEKIISSSYDNFGDAQVIEW